MFIKSGIYLQKTSRFSIAIYTKFNVKILFKFYVGVEYTMDDRIFTEKNIKQ